jgi:hypothetical protein
MFLRQHMVGGFWGRLELGLDTITNDQGPLVGWGKKPTGSQPSQNEREEQYGVPRQNCPLSIADIW